MTAASALVAWVLSVPIVLYRALISPLLGHRCRFHPSCSEYALGALRLHGPVIGLWRSVRRVLRCNPWNPGGHDPP